MTVKKFVHHFGFNPTLVRLRRRVGTHVHYAPFGFNPTLVRLRRYVERFRERARKRFQSHAGSIEADILEADCLHNHNVSIPRWFD